MCIHIYIYVSISCYDFCTVPWGAENRHFSEATGRSDDLVAGASHNIQPRFHAQMSHVADPGSGESAGETINVICHM